MSEEKSRSGIIAALLGRSASGKDSVLKRLVADCGFRRVIPCTTRPIRPGETDGVDYRFMTREEFFACREAGGFIETREYNTLYRGVPDTWYYGTAREGIDLSSADYAAIVDMGALEALKKEFGSRLRSVLITAPEPVRRERCLRRGDLSLPEWLRREADDDVKFAPERLEGKIDLTVENEDLDAAFERIVSFLRDTV